MEKNWFNLYKVLDASRRLKGDPKPSFKALKVKKWVSESEIERFLGTANNHTAAQGEHGTATSTRNPWRTP